MITYRIGRHEVLLPISHNYNKICDILGFLKLRQENFFISSENSHLSARVLSNYLGMMRSVLLHCPISAEIRTDDSQSDLRILL